MLIFFLSAKDREDPNLSSWLGELSTTGDVVIAPYEKEVPEKIERLFTPEQVIDIPLGGIADAHRGAVVGIVDALSKTISSMTHRQQNALALVADGLSNKLIAIQLGATSSEIRGDLKKIFRVLGVNNRTAAALLQRTLPPPPLAGGLVKPVRVLLAEDNFVSQMLVAAQLRSLGHDVDIATDGLEAVEAIFEKLYDVVLMDIQMPKMDGLDATAAIRALAGEQAHISIIAMTAHAMEDDRSRFLSAGMDDYLPKPASRSDIATALARWLPFGKLTIGPVVA